MWLTTVPGANSDCPGCGVCEGEEEARTTFQRVLFKNKSEAGTAKASTESKDDRVLKKGDLVSHSTCRGPLRTGPW